MPLYRNVIGQKVAIFAWDITNDEEKTGDAANITAQISLDGSACVATTDTNPTELDATDAPGIYIFDLEINSGVDETDGYLFVLFAKSTTPNIKIEPVIIYTDVYNASTINDVKNAVDGLNDISVTDIGTAVEAQFTATNTELAAIPTTTGGLRTMIQFIFQYFRNARTETAGTESLKKEDGTTELGSRTLADDGNVFTRGEMN